MKQYSILFLFPLVCLISLFVYTKIAGPIPFSVSQVTTNKQDSFVSTGEGKFFIKPDVAVVSLGIQASGASVKDVQQKINSVNNAVVKSVQSVGVDSKDIKTVNYSISPTYDYSAGQRITGYQANSSLSVKIRDLAKVNTIIDSATSAGANQVGGVSFDVDDRTSAENEARKLAVAQAKSKAEAASKIAGFKLGRIINYSEGFSGIVRPMMALSALKAPAMEDTGTKVEPGTSEISVTVSLSYEIL